MFDRIRQWRQRRRQQTAPRLPQTVRPAATEAPRNDYSPVDHLHMAMLHQQFMHSSTPAPSSTPISDEPKSYGSISDSYAASSYSSDTGSGGGDGGSGGGGE